MVQNASAAWRCVHVEEIYTRIKASYDLIDFFDMFQESLCFRIDMDIGYMGHYTLPRFEWVPGTWVVRTSALGDFFLLSNASLS